MRPRFTRFGKTSSIDPTFYVGSDEPHNEEVVRERFAAKAKRYLRYLPLAQETVAMYFCLLDARTPIWVKATAAAALAYFIMPLDAMPDLLPVVGLSDDAGVIAATLTAIAAHITDEHRAKAKGWMEAEIEIEPHFENFQG
jgi:uncharacterized membrane protein YkvA (DUF1232 family)